MDPEFLRQLKTVFAAEAGEKLEALHATIAALARGTAAEQPALAQQAMRDAHGLKGSAASVGLEDVARCAHALEDVLSGVSRGEAPFDAGHAASVLDALQRTLAAGLESGDRVAAHVVGLAEDAEVAAAALHSVRVDSRRLDRLMGFAPDLLEVRVRIDERSRAIDAFGEDFAGLLRKLPDTLRAEGKALAAQLSRVTRTDRQDAHAFHRLGDELRGALHQIRLVPLRSLAPAWRAAAQDAAHAGGKEVDLQLDAGDVELDKEVLDRVREAVIHLLRNAVSHGIEAPAARAAAGKSPRGVVRLSARMDGDRVRLEVADDGAGLDLAALGRAALAAGRISADALQALPEDRLSELVFETGVSTRGEVDRVSGRGVGLDSVRRAVVALGGHSTATRAGALGGAAFTLSFPVQLLSIRGLIVRVAGVVYAVPSTFVERCLRVAAADIQALGGSTAIRLKGQAPLRMFSLGTVLGLADGATVPGGKQPVVVLARGSTRAAMAVAEVLREEEFVVRPLPWNLTTVRGICGATALGDGTLAPVLDVDEVLVRGLAERARPDGTERAGAPPPGAAPPRGRARVLVADDSPAIRESYRMLLASSGYDVAVAEDGAVAYEVLSRGGYDLLVSDIQMPRLDGLELTRKLRAHPSLSRLPVVLSTSLGRPEDVARGMEAGADEYVVKEHAAHGKLLAAVARHA